MVLSVALDQFLWSQTSGRISHRAWKPRSKTKTLISYEIGQCHLQKTKTFSHNFPSHLWRWLHAFFFECRLLLLFALLNWFSSLLEWKSSALQTIVSLHFSYLDSIIAVVCYIYLAAFIDAHTGWVPDLSIRFASRAKLMQKLSLRIKHLEGHKHTTYNWCHFSEHLPKLCRNLLSIWEHARRNSRYGPWDFDLTVKLRQTSAHCRWKLHSHPKIRKVFNDRTQNFYWYRHLYACDWIPVIKISQCAELILYNGAGTISELCW